MYKIVCIAFTGGACSSIWHWNDHSINWLSAAITVEHSHGYSILFFSCNSLFCSEIGRSPISILSFVSNVKEQNKSPSLMNVNLLLNELD